MGSDELASTRFRELSSKLSDIEKLPGFGEGEWLFGYREAAMAVLEFVSARPAMIVADSLDLDKILGFLQTERNEAREAESEGGLKLYEELGDVGFFVLLTTMLYGEELTDENNDKLREMMEYAENQGKSDNLSLPLTIMYVALHKDWGNYPELFYQLGEEELTETIPDRVEQTVPAIRDVRPFLNGEWENADDLIDMMREHGENAGWIGKESEAIMLLFGLAGIAVSRGLQR